MPSLGQPLAFSLHDVVEGQPITPKNVDLLTLHQFMGEVIVHLVLPSGESIKVEASESQLEGADYLYKAITLNVHAMEHIRSGQLRDLRLIDVVRPLKEIDEDKLKTLWRKGRNAWAEITSPTEWVERLRES